MLNLLLKPLLGVAGQAVSGFVETKKAKAQLKLTEVQAATKLKQDQIAGKVAWEASAVLYIACSASFGIKGAKGAMGLIKKK